MQNGPEVKSGPGMEGELCSDREKREPGGNPKSKITVLVPVIFERRLLDCYADARNDPVPAPIAGPPHAPHPRAVRTHLFVYRIL